MALAQDITFNRLHQPLVDSRGVSLSATTGGQSQPLSAADEDLFQKYILDKESASNSGEKSVFEDTPLDNEEVQMHGFLSAREQQTVGENIDRKGTKSISGQKGHFTGRGLSRMDSAVPDAAHRNASPKTVKPELAQNKQPRQADNSGVKFNFSGATRGKTGQAQNIQQQGTVAAPKIPIQAAAAKFESISKQVQQPQSKVLKEKPVTILQQASHNSSSGKSGISSLSRGQSQGESFPDNTNSPHSQGENSGQNQSERRGDAILPELMPQVQQENVQQLNGMSPTSSSVVPHAQTGVYGGVIGQLADQLFRLQQSGGTSTSRVTLDLPDGEKLLVRFHVRGNQGMQIQFSTRSKGLKNALEESWDQLKVEAGQKGITLDDPAFEGIEEETTEKLSLEQNLLNAR
jgi:hypothetical protein